MGGYGPDMSALTLLSKDSLARVLNSIPGRWGWVRAGVLGNPNKLFHFCSVEVFSFWFILALVIIAAQTPIYIHFFGLILVVSYQSRWSFSFILGPLHWSSSWQWRHCIAGCRSFQTLLWAELADFAQFFLQKVSFIYVTKPQNLSGMVWRRFTPQKQPGKLTLGVFSGFTE